MSQSTIYDQATKAVVKMLETAGTDCHQPWQVNGSRNVITDKLYRGVNTLILGSTPYLLGTWGTFKQWKHLGHPVRKGQKSTGIAFFKPIIKETVRPDGRTEEESYMVIRSYNVFAAEQVTGYPIEVPNTVGDNHRNQQAEDYFRRTGARLQVGIDRAYYSPSGDCIGMPSMSQFDTTDTYYSTLFHELTHWTGTHGRCNREMGKRFGDKQYAIEELVAELGAIFHCLHLGVIAYPKEESAKYPNSWLRVLNDDKKLVFTASSLAQKAMDYTVSLQEEAEQVA